METTTAINRTELAAELRGFLREHRERWTAVRNPRTAELDVRARSEGENRWLTLEALAELTGYSYESLAVFCRGGMRNPKPEFLARVADTMRMPLVDRKHMWHLATGGPPPTTADCHRMWADDLGLAALVEDNYPRPSFLLDPAFRVLAYNDAVPMWMWDPSQQPELRDNFARWLFTHPHAQHVFPHWEEIVTPVMLSRIRAIRANLPHDPYVNELIATLCEESDWARQLWEEEAAVAEWPAAQVIRIPGRTDPDQREDEKHQITAGTVFLSSPAEGDERLLVTFRLPSGLQGRMSHGVRSEHACAACMRQAVDTAIPA